MDTLKKNYNYLEKHHMQINRIFLLMDVALFIGFFIHNNIVFASAFAFFTGVGIINYFADPLIENQQHLIKLQRNFIKEIMDKIRKDNKN